MSTGADAPSTGTSLASDPQHPAPQRSLWIGGLSAEVSDELLQSRLEAVRARVATAHTSSASSRDFGSFAVRRMLEASGAWVDFTSSELAQEVITVLNGTTLGPGAILVRYSRQVTSPSSSPSPALALGVTTLSVLAPYPRPLLAPGRAHHHGAQCVPRGAQLDEPPATEQRTRRSRRGRRSPRGRYRRGRCTRCRRCRRSRRRPGAIGGGGGGGGGARDATAAARGQRSNGRRERERERAAARGRGQAQARGRWRGG